MGGGGGEGPDVEGGMRAGVGTEARHRDEEGAESIARGGLAGRGDDEGCQSPTLWGWGLGTARCADGS